MKRGASDSDAKCPQYYKVGDKVEAVKLNIGAWFNADIIDIYPKLDCECYNECRCLFKILFESEEEHAVIAERTLNEIRQVTYSSLEWDSLKVGMRVVINYNIKNPDQWGYWYDYVITHIDKRNDIVYVKGTLLVGYDGVTDKIPVEINSDTASDVLEIRPHATVFEKEMESYETGVKPEYCKHCKNRPKAKCKKCCCCKCGIKKDFHLTVLCDECADWYHIYCLNPPMNSIPDDDDWYCPKCNNETFRVATELKLKSKILKKKKKQKKNKDELEWNERTNNKTELKERTNNKAELKERTNNKTELKERTNNKTELKERTINKMDWEEKSENRAACTKRQPELKPKVADVKRTPTKRIKSEIPKNSVIWNDVEKLFPKYEIIQITVELADKNADENDSILNPTLERIIYSDEINEHLWNEAKESVKKGKEAFLNHVRRLFTCSICCDLMKEPITLSCRHSFCITCFFRSLSVNVYNCALCRTDVIHTEHYRVNENLTKALELLFHN